MKNLFFKTSFIFISLLILSLVQAGSAFATNDAQSIDEILFDKLLAESNTSRSSIMPEKIWDINKGELRGENIYLSLTNEMADKPLKEAIKKVSREVSFKNIKTGKDVFFTEAEWRDIYLTGKIQILRDNLGITNSQIASSYYDTITQSVTDEIKNNQFLAELEADSASTEIATAMLVPDTEIMALILFGKIDPSDYDNARAAVNLPPISTYADSESVDTVSSHNDTAGSDASSSQIAVYAPADQSFADDKKEFPGPSTDTSAVLYNPTGLNPLQCSSDTNIDDAVGEYINELPPENPLSDLKSRNNDNSTSDSTSDSGKPPSANDTGSGLSIEPPIPSSEESFNEIPPAEEHKWINQEICTNGNIFCIEVRFINNGQECDFGGDGNSCASIGPSGDSSSSSGSSYVETDNCIACHTKFMLENMELLLSKTLTPSKAPGNLLESGKCKKGFLKIKPSLNIYAIKKPIPAPPETAPLFQSTNPFEDFGRELTEGFGFGKGGRTDQVTKHTVQFANSRNINSIFGEIDDATKTRQDELDFNREMALLQQDMDSYAKGYADVSIQLEQFNSLISALDEINQQINTNSCEDLRSKKACE